MALYGFLSNDPLSLLDYLGLSDGDESFFPWPIVEPILRDIIEDWIEVIDDIDPVTDDAFDPLVPPIFRPPLPSPYEPVPPIDIGDLIERGRDIIGDIGNLIGRGRDLIGDLIGRIRDGEEEEGPCNFGVCQPVSARLRTAAWCRCVWDCENVENQVIFTVPAPGGASVRDRDCGVIEERNGVRVLESGECSRTNPSGQPIDWRPDGAL